MLEALIIIVTAVFILFNILLGLMIIGLIIQSVKDICTIFFGRS